MLRSRSRKVSSVNPAKIDGSVTCWAPIEHLRPQGNLDGARIIVSRGSPVSGHLLPVADDGGAGRIAP
jgi:hypothetical protein